MKKALPLLLLLLTLQACAKSPAAKDISSPEFWIAFGGGSCSGGIMSGREY